MKKNICMIAYTTYRSDPRVRREAETLAGLEKYEVVVLVPKEGNSSNKYVMNEVQIIELNVKKYQGKSGIRYLFSYLKFLVLAFAACTRLFIERKLDVVHVHNMPDFLIFAAIVPRLFGRKVILDIHDSLPETYGAKFQKKSRMLFKIFCLEESLCCRIAHKIICVNHPQRDALAQRGIPLEKIVISMNVPDERWFTVESMDKEESKPLETFGLVYHGTLAKRLGLDLTIRAVSKLIDEIPGLEFHVFGEGDDADEFVSLSKQLGLERRIHFNKIVSLERLTAVLQPMQVGVISNRRNMATELMLPVKMLEYIALDIPVVAPRLRAIQHYFSDGMVKYFEADNVDSLVDAICELSRSESKRKEQAQLAKRFLDTYGWQKTRADLIKLYEEV